MATVLRFPQPVLELSLEAGGSLQANTTYYFTGAYYKTGGINGYYTGFTSKAAAEASITTDDTNKSIRIKFKWDNGGTWTYTYPAYAAATTIKWDTATLISGGEFRYAWEQCRLIQDGGVNYLLSAEVAKGWNYLAWHPEFHDYLNCFNTLFERNKGTCLVAIDSAADTYNTIAAAVNAVSDRVCRMNSQLHILGDITFYKAITLDGTNISLWNGAWNIVEIPTIKSANIYICGGGYTVISGNLIACKIIYDGVRNAVGMDNIRTSINCVYSLFNLAAYSETFRNKTFHYMNINSVYPYILLQAPQFQNLVLYNTAISPLYPYEAGWLIFDNIKQYTHAASEIQYYAYQRDIDVNDFKAAGWGQNLDMLGYQYINYFLSTDRPTSDGINYVAENKPRIHWYYISTGFNDAVIQFIYTVSLYVEAPDGTKISGADVVLTNKISAEEYSGATDVNGYVTFNVLSREARQKNVGGQHTFETDWTDMPDYLLEIAKSGYQEYKSDVYILSQTSLQIALSIIPLSISSVNFTHPTLLANNGTITIVAVGGVAPYEYSIDGGDTWQSSGIYTDLEEGTYEILIRDDDGGEASGVTVILKATDFVIDTIAVDLNEDLEAEILTQPEITAEILESIESDTGTDPVINAELNKDIESTL